MSVTPANNVHQESHFSERLSEKFAGPSRRSTGRPQAESDTVCAGLASPLSSRPLVARADLGRTPVTQADTNSGNVTAERTEATVSEHVPANGHISEPNRLASFLANTQSVLFAGY
jgi:hypothetical protein